MFVDVDLPMHNVNADLVEGAVSPRTKAIVLEHPLGNPFALERIVAITKKHPQWLIEDNCDALRAEFPGIRTGTLGDIATGSVYPAHHIVSGVPHYAHHITTGEGGALFTHNVRLKLAMESFRAQGRDCRCEPGKGNTCGKRFAWRPGTLPRGYGYQYACGHIGYNVATTDMQAAVGLSQMGKLPQFT